MTPDRTLAVPPSVQKVYDAALQGGAMQPDTAQQAAVATLDKLFTTITTRRKSRWLTRLFAKPPETRAGAYLYGPVGRGKSMLMQFFIDALAQWNAQAAPENRHRVERHHFHEFMLALHHQLFLIKNKPDAPDDPVAWLADELANHIDVLCFDEFVVTDVADAMLLMPYFTHVLARGVRLVTTSNFAPAELYKNGLQRGRFLPFIALLQDRLDIACVGGPQDYRRLRWQDKANQQDHWLMPLNDTTALDMAKIFSDLAGYDTVHDDEDVAVPEQQRSIHVAKATPHVAWLNMVDMLDRSAGAADFLALATRFRALLLDGIVPFAANENNRAKRFMLLIDTLYEAGTQIYVRAATDPDALYPADGRLAFEFARTISRLQEMRYPKKGTTV